MASTVVEKMLAACKVNMVSARTLVRRSWSEGQEELCWRG